MSRTEWESKYRSRKVVKWWLTLFIWSSTDCWLKTISSLHRLLNYADGAIKRLSPRIVIAAKHTTSIFEEKSNFSCVFCRKLKQKNYLTSVGLKKERIWRVHLMSEYTKVRRRVPSGKEGKEYWNKGGNRVITNLAHFNRYWLLIEDHFVSRLSIDLWWGCWSNIIIHNLPSIQTNTMLTFK